MTSGPVFEVDPGALATHAQRLVEELNESLRLAGQSHVAATRRSRLAVAIDRFGKLKELIEWSPSLKLQNLAAVEQSIADVQKETDELYPARAADDFLTLSLPEQCRMLGIKLDVVELERRDKLWRFGDGSYIRPEQAALAYFETQGFSGLACEGTAPLMLMKSACLDFLARVNPFGSRTDACTRYFEAQCQIHADRAEEILHQVKSADEKTVRRNLREIVAQPSYSNLHDAIDENAMMAIWRALTPAGLGELTERILEDPGRRAGWPDLTLAKDSQLLFVEVKTTDRLHGSQRSVIEDVLIPFGASVRVVQLQSKGVPKAPPI